MTKPARARSIDLLLLLLFPLTAASGLLCPHVLCCRTHRALGLLFSFFLFLHCLENKERLVKHVRDVLRASP